MRGLTPSIIFTEPPASPTVEPEATPQPAPQTDPSADDDVILDEDATPVVSEEGLMIRSD